MPSRNQWIRDRFASIRWQKQSQVAQVVSRSEQLEAQALMAADLGITISDSKGFYSPATQTTYTVEVTNFGDASATNATLTTVLGSQITQKTWTATYTSGSSGPVIGAGDLNTRITLAAGGKATFTIFASISDAATGELVSTASVALAGEANTANNSASDIDQFVPRSINVTTALNINFTLTRNGLIITGNDAANRLSGTVFADTLIGNGGNDTLNGRLGNDILTGGAGADIFRFASALNGTTNVDRITDFTPTADSATTDLIQLENTGTRLFTAITETGTLATTAFVSGAAFTTAAQRIRYDGSTGNLFYDADGSGTGSASILFATLNIGLDINNTQFVVT